MLPFNLRLPVWLIYFVLGLGLLLSVSGCQSRPALPSPPPPPPTNPPPAADLPPDAFFEAFSALLVSRDPEWVVSLGLQAVYPGVLGRLTDRSPAFQAETYQLLNEYAQRLAAYESVEWDAGQRLSADVLAWYLTDAGRLEPFQAYTYAVNPVFGAPWSTYRHLLSEHPLQTPADVEGYIQRLIHLETVLEQVIQALNAGEAQGVIPPHPVLQASIGQIDSFSAAPAGQHPFVTHLQTAVNQMPGLSPALRGDLTRQAEEAIRHHVYPGYAALRAHLTDLLTRAPQAVGMWQYPNGEAYYAAALRHHTTTDLTATEIHALGLAEVARLQAELGAIFNELGYPAQPLTAHLAQAAREGGSMPTTTPAERDAAAAEYARLIRQAEVALAPYFERQPAADLEVAYETGGGAAYYLPPALDGSRPGLFFAQFGGPTQPRYAMPTLAYHEGIPGHHFQIGLQSELTDVPLFRTALHFTAYTEGWALYAERLAWEGGLYEEDVYGNVGRLQMELFRAARLVVDTGLHAQRWTRAEALAYLIANTGLPEAMLSREVDRYISWPGQACAYTLGMLKILELRAQAQTTLGAAFDWRAFHTAVLENGPLPLEILEQQVQAFIAHAAEGEP